MISIKKTLIKLAVLAALPICLTGCSANFSMNTNYIYENGDKYSAGDREISDKVDTINIDYMSGEITMTGEAQDGISIKETSSKNLSEDQKVHTWVDGSTLYVRYCASKKNLDLNNLNKHLEISVPKDVKLENLTVDISSGELSSSNIEVSKIDAEASSGSLSFDGKADDVTAEVSSGTIDIKLDGKSTSLDFTASSGNIKADIEEADKLVTETSSGNTTVKAAFITDINSTASSGKMNFTLDKAPTVIKMNASSGDITLALPEKSNYTAKVETSSGEFDYELPFEKKGSTYIIGSGEGTMDITTTSGNVKINEN